MIMARAMASCCCWPPERSPPRRAVISLRTGTGRRFLWDFVVGFGEKGEGGFQVFFDGEEGEDHPALWHDCEAALGHVLRAEFAQGFAIEFNGASGTYAGACESFQEAGFTDAICADDAGDFACFGFKIDAMQDLAAVVMQGQASGFDHHPRPK